jgi:hypothetical protein
VMDLKVLLIPTQDVVLQQIQDHTLLDHQLEAIRADLAETLNLIEALQDRILHHQMIVGHLDLTLHHRAVLEAATEEVLQAVALLDQAIVQDAEEEAVDANSNCFNKLIQ